VGGFAGGENFGGQPEGHHFAADLFRLLRDHHQVGGTAAQGLGLGVGRNGEHLRDLERSGIGIRVNGADHLEVGSFDHRRQEL
jgi:hypothetical protein